MDQAGFGGASGLVNTVLRPGSVTLADMFGLFRPESGVTVVQGSYSVFDRTILPQFPSVLSNVPLNVRGV